MMNESIVQNELEQTPPEEIKKENDSDEPIHQNNTDFPTLYMRNERTTTQFLNLSLHMKL